MVEPADSLALQAELLSLVGEVPAFKEYNFTAYDFDDVTEQTTLGRFPAVGVIYNGAVPIDKNGQAVTGVPVDSASGAVTMCVMQFTVVIAIQYHYGGQNDTKPQAMALLTDIRKRVNGVRKVNTRPWRFYGEKPEPAASGDGIVFYSQVWQTVVPSIGTFNQS